MAGELHPRNSLDVNQTVDKTDARTNERHKDKAKNQFIVSDSTDEGLNPSDRRSDPRADIRHHSGNAVCSRSARQLTPFHRPRCMSRSSNAIETKAKKKPTK